MHLPIILERGSGSIYREKESVCVCGGGSLMNSSDFVVVINLFYRDGPIAS